MVDVEIEGEADGGNTVLVIPKSGESEADGDGTCEPLPVVEKYGRLAEGFRVGLLKTLVEGDNDPS